MRRKLSLAILTAIGLLAILVPFVEAGGKVFAPIH
jgi:hypothetical protein